MSHQESGLEDVITVVAGGVEDVGHPVGGCLWQDGGDESEVVLLGRGATQEELGLCDPKPGGGAGCPEVGQLEEAARRLPGGAAAASWAAALSSCTLMLAEWSCSEKSAKRNSWDHHMLLVLNWCIS